MAITLSLGIEQFEVKNLEKEYRLSLPSDYIDFLTRHNGLFLRDKSYSNLSFHKVDDGEVSFQALFGIKMSNDNFDLAYINKYRDEVIALDNPFIIGEDPGGNLFLLNGNGRDHSIYYWDRTHLHLSDEGHPDYPEKNEEGDIYTFFESFDKFYRTIISSVEGDTDIVEEQL